MQMSSRLPAIDVPVLRLPASAQEILQKYRRYLTQFEEFEITLFDQVYYLRNSPPMRQIAGSNEGTFRFEKDEHICYRYQQIRILGSGSNGWVIEARDHKEGKDVAIKMLKDEPRRHDQIKTEERFISSLGKVPRGAIVEFIESFEFRGYIGIVMELGDIDTYTALRRQNMRGFSKASVQKIGKQIGEALLYVHERGIIHGDIKPENVLLMDSSRVTLIDFGCSCVLEDAVFTYIQSRYYRAPEVILGLKYGVAIDIWSYGCLLCELITGKALFESRNEDELIRKITAIIGNPPLWMVRESERGDMYYDESGNLLDSEEQISDQPSKRLREATGIQDETLLKLIEGCLQWDPSQRLKEKAIVGHPWFRESSNPRFCKKRNMRT